MRDILQEVEKWRLEGKQIALATVVKVYGSAPRALGAKMAISDAGDMAGSVSGGCVEGAVYEEAQECIKHNQSKLLHYGVTNDVAWSVGLACGGQIEVFVEPLILSDAVDLPPATETYANIRDNIQREELCAQVTVIKGSFTGKKLLFYAGDVQQGDLGYEALNQAAIKFVKEHLHELQSQRFELEVNGQPYELFLDVFLPQERLIIVGAVHVAIPLVHFARQLGFYSIVLDARSAFATQERFPHADEIQVVWPAEALEKLNINEATYIVVVSHDEKIDNPALKVAIESKARYIGALGSQKTHRNRVAALKDMGLSDAAIERIHGPVGVPLGAIGPEEIALSIAAELVQARRHLI